MKNVTGGMFGKVRAFFADLTGKNSFGKLDFGILKTLMMLAAVDGELGDAEISFFREMAAKCRGYNGESFDALWDSAVRSAGYILLQTRFLPQDGLVAAFVREAEADFVAEVSLEPTQERDRAFACLASMAEADGTYSMVERACISALAKKVIEARNRVISERYPRAVLFPEPKC